MEKLKQIEKCMKMQCDFCKRKDKCNKEIEREEDYGINPGTDK